MFLFVHPTVMLGLKLARMTTRVEDWLSTLDRDMRNTCLDQQCVTFAEMYSNGKGICNN